MQRTLVQLAGQGAGLETFRTFTSEDELELVKSELVVFGIEKEVEAHIDGTNHVDTLLHAMGEVHAVGKTVTGDNAGMESVKDVFVGYMTNQIGDIGMPLVAGAGLEKEGNYLQKAAVLARKAWISIKNFIMKNIAKLVGWVTNQGKKLEELKKTLDELEDTPADSFIDSQLTAIGDVGKGFLLNEEVKRDPAKVLGFIDTQIKLMQSFLVPTKSSAELIEDRERYLKSGGDIASFTKTMGDDLDKNRKYSYIAGISKGLLISTKVDGKDLGLKVETRSYSVLDETKSNMRPLTRTEMSDYIEEAVKANKDYSKTVDDVFKMMDKNSEILSKSLDKYREDATDDEKLMFNADKQKLSASPTIAFFLAMQLNKGIKWMTVVVEQSITAHKDEIAKAAK